jgi:hypothetical protein
MAKKYIPSEEATFTGVLKTVLFGILGCLLLPLLLVMVNYWIPNIWFAAISAVMFGLGLGFFIDLGIGLGKIRNIKVAAVIERGFELLAYYMQWIFFAEVIVYESNGGPVKYITVINTSVVRQKLGKDNIRKDVLIKYYPITDPSF